MCVCVCVCFHERLQDESVPDERRSNTQDKKMRASFPAWLARDLEMLFRQNYPMPAHVQNYMSLCAWQEEGWVKGFSLDRFGGYTTTTTTTTNAGTTGGATTTETTSVQLQSIMALEVKVARSLLAVHFVPTRGSNADGCQIADGNTVMVVEKFMQSLSNAMQLSVLARCNRIKVGNMDRKRKNAGSDQEGGDDGSD